ncbi:DUF5988 family protein [Kitasatospora sp. NPDC057904]|uniref:DUF5988 family protein n=1 Tax=Kitasatospora sp. NPDC057904 TaxID=3346275 RepID=UPI0036DC5EEF
MSAHITPEPGELVALRGGPSGSARLYRIPPGDADPSRVVVTLYGRHQHFERTSATESVSGARIPVFQWSYSTAVAE